MPRLRTTVLVLLFGLAGTSSLALAQRGMGRGGRGGFPPQPPRQMGPGPLDTNQAPGARDTGMTVPPSPEDARVAQRDFEHYRLFWLKDSNLGRGSGECDETIGRWCYWYDAKAPPPPVENPAVGKARLRLLALLDSIALTYPGERWVAGQRVRYLLETDRLADAEKAARACTATGPWCPQLIGLALHEASNYAGAEAAFGKAITAMTQLEKCRWSDIVMLLDDALRGRYNKMTCEQKAAFEQRFWWLARPFYGLGPNDARTEFHARLTMAQILDGTISGYQNSFDKDEREMLIRYGWSRAWSKNRQSGLSPSEQIVGHERVPAYPFVPLTGMFDYPWRTDSSLWAPDYRPAYGRYGPSYAKALVPLMHQAGLFRRGDTAVVVVAWDASDQKPPAGPFDASIIVSDSGLRAGVAHATMNGTHGVLTARTTWGGVLLSAELRNDKASWAARSRYGMQPPLAVGSRVTLSDLLLYKPSDDPPNTLEEAAAVAFGTLKVKASQKVGLYWELYGVDAAGEQATVTITVVPDQQDAPGFFTRQARRLNLMKATEPVSISIGDQTTPGVNRASRAVALDLSTLNKGVWRIEVDIELKGQPYALHAERTIDVTSK